MQANRRILTGSLALLVFAAATSERVETARAQASPSQAAAPVSVLTDESDGETLFVRVGDLVGVRLTERAPGAAWSVKSISNDGALLIGSIDSDAAENVSTATFKAVQAGIVTITLVNAPTGPDSANPIAMYTFKLNVQSAATPAGHAGPGSKFVPTSFEAPSASSQSVRYQDGSAYDGALSNGLPTGYGTFNYSPTDPGNVQRASGTWEGGALTNGEVLLRDGARYFGGLDASGKADGPAHFELTNGGVISTTFQHGDYSGKTTWRQSSYAGGGASQSTIVVDVDPPSPTLTGPAVETYANGTRLVATMQNGQFEGPGTFSSAALGSFSSTFVDGVMQGRFRWIDSDGNRITGYMRDGAPVGVATMASGRGKLCRGRVSHLHDDYDFNAFTGTYDSDNRPDGRGVLGCAGSEQLTGHWIHGKMVGLIIDHFPDGTVYKVNVGPSPSDTLTGPARVILPGGDVALGFMRSDASGGALEGPGSITYGEDGETAYGTWHHGRFSQRT